MFDYKLVLGGGCCGGVIEIKGSCFFLLILKYFLIYFINVYEIMLLQKILVYLINNSNTYV